MKDKAKKILIYGGTTEGRKLAEELCGYGLSCTVCVATAYGRQVMESVKGLQIHVGRMDAEEMRELAESEEYLAVIDATHPYAVEATENIKKSIRSAKIPYLRLKRRTEDLAKTQGNVRWFSDSKSCAEALRQVKGNILLTTGSKELAAFSAEELRDRLFVRVLPSIESLRLCEEQGICGRQIIAMQGPFSKQMNSALFRQYAIQCMVTKESGGTGGFLEKLEAAQETGILTYIIGNPEAGEAGYSDKEIVKKLYGWLGQEKERRKAQIALIGIGPGNGRTLTLDAMEKLKHAKVVFGAGRLLEGIHLEKEKYPYYTAEDILPKLKELSVKREDSFQAAVLFSGDTGFYSGADKLYKALEREIEAKRLDAVVEIFPGISSMSYLAAKAKMSWQDAKAVSIHGRKENILHIVKSNAKVFLLVTGAEDMRSLGELLCRHGLTHLLITMGFCLSYPEEEIRRITPKECLGLEKEGLYCCFIENRRPEKERLTHGLADNFFLRGNVPMTKEEIRDIAICKLRLTKDAVLYDIGSGTGSVAVECGLLAKDMKVYAVEHKKEAANLIRENCKKAGVDNVDVLETAAPLKLEGLPVPSHAFIGGSGGYLKEIFAFLYDKNPKLRVVVHAITLETIGNVTGLLKEFPVEDEEIVQVQVNRAKIAGKYHLMQGENPVYILSFNFKEISK